MTNQKTFTALDQDITIAKHRLGRLQGERRREAFRIIDAALRCLDQELPVSAADPEGVDHRLIEKLDQLIAIVDREVARIESLRAAMLLAEIE